MTDLLALIVLPAVLFAGAVWAIDQLAHALRQRLRERRRQLAQITEKQAQAMARPHSGVVQVSPRRPPLPTPDPAD